MSADQIIIKRIDISTGHGVVSFHDYFVFVLGLPEPLMFSVDLFDPEAKTVFGELTVYGADVDGGAVESLFQIGGTIFDGHLVIDEALLKIRKSAVPVFLPW